MDNDASAETARLAEIVRAFAIRRFYKAKQRFEKYKSGLNTEREQLRRVTQMAYGRLKFNERRVS